MKGAKGEEPHIWLSHAGPPPLLALLAGVRGAAGGTEDVHLVCRGGARLPAHRALLAAASPMLRKVMQTHSGEDGPLVVVVEEEQEEVENLLDLLYTGTGAQRDGLKGVLCTFQVNQDNFWSGKTKTKKNLTPHSDPTPVFLEKMEPEECTFVKDEAIEDYEPDNIDDFVNFEMPNHSSSESSDSEWGEIKKQKKKKVKVKTKDVTKNKEDNAEKKGKESLQGHDKNCVSAPSNTSENHTILDIDIDALVSKINKDPTLTFSQTVKGVSLGGHYFNGPKTCQPCNRKFNDRRAHISHVAEHKRGPNSLCCEKCQFKTSVIKTLIKHVIANHIDEQNILCPNCGDSFPNTKMYKIHKKLKHRIKQRRIKRNTTGSETIVSGETIMCDFCAKVVTKNNLKTHIKMVHEECEVWTCEECGLTFKTKHYKEKHMILHNAPSEPCPHCGKMFHPGRNLERHVSNQHRSNEDKDLHCTQCGKGFNTRPALEGHMNMHLGLKPYECRYCSSCYANQSNCSAHEKKTHSDIYTPKNKGIGGAKVRDRLNVNEPMFS